MRINRPLILKYVYELAKTFSLLIATATSIMSLINDHFFGERARA